MARILYPDYEILDTSECECGDDRKITQIVVNDDGDTFVVCGACGEYCPCYEDSDDE